MAFSRRPPNDDDDDNERPDPPRWSSRPPGDEPGRPASRFGSDRPGTRDSESGDDFGFVRDRLGPSRRPGTPPDEPKDEGGGLVGGLFRRSKKEDDKDAPPPRSGSKPVTGSRPAPSAGRPVPPTAGRSSTPAGGARGDSADDEKKGRFGFLGRGSKDADKDEPPGRSSSTRRSPFLSSTKDDDPPPRSGSSLRDSQRAAGKTGPLPSRPGLGGDDENRSGPAFRPGGSSTPNRFGGAGGAGSPTDRPGSYGSRPGVPDRDADKDQPGGGRPAFGAGRSPFGTRPGSADDDDKDPPGGGRPAFGAGRSPFGTRPGSTDDDDKDPPGGGRPPFGTRPGADRSNQPGTGDRPGTGPARFGGAGGTGGSTDRPGGFGTRPGADRDQPGTGDRPGAGPARFGGAGGTGGSTDRPGSFGTRPGADRDQPGSGTSRFGGAGGTGGPADRPGSFGTRPGADRDQPGAGDRSGSGTSRFGGAGGIGGTGSSNSAADRTGSFGSRPGALGDRGDTGAGLGQRSSSSQTRGFPSRPLGREEEKKDEPRKSRLGGLLGRGKEEKKDDKKQDKRASAKTSSTPTAQPRFGGGTASSTLDKRRSTTTDTFGTATDARGRGQTAAPGRGADKTATGTTRRAVPASSVSREKAKPLPGQQRSALTVHQGLDFERRIDLIGVTLLGFALVSFFAVIPSITLGLLPEPHSGAIGAINHLLSQMFGWGKVVWPLIAGGLGIWLMRESFAERGFELDFFRIVGMILLYTCLLTWIQMFELVNDSAPTVEQFKPISYDLAVGQGQGGGWLGHTIYVFLLGQLLDWGTLSVLLAWLVMSLMLTFDLSLVELGGYVAAALAVFTISEEQRTRKRVAREALADEFKATMRPPEKEGAQTVLPGITTTVETPAVGKRGGAAARAAAPTTATAPDLPAVGRRGPAAPAGDPLAPAAPVPASPEPVRPALGESPQMPPVRSGPVINRRTGGFNGESTDEVLPGRDRAAEGTGPLSPMAGEAKTGEAGAATLSPRRMPHFRAGATDETNAVTPDQAESASGVDASKADDDASKRRFGFLGRGRDRAADQETPAADQPAAESSGVRRSPFARPGADPSAGESAPGIPVPGRPASASAPGESKPASEESGSRFGLLRRGGSSADSPAETSAADSTTPKEESRGGFGLGRFRRGGGASEEKEPLADSAAAPVSPESDKPAGEPGARRSPFSPTRSMSDPSRTSPLDEPKTDDSAPAGEPGLRRSPFSSTRSMSDPSRTSPVDEPKTDDSAPAGEPGLRRSPFSPTRSMSDPSRTSPLDEPKTDDSAPAGEPGLRRSPFSSTRSMSDPARTSPLDEPKTDDSAPAGEPGVRRSPFSSTRAMSDPSRTSPLDEPKTDDSAPAGEPGARRSPFAFNRPSSPDASESPLPERRSGPFANMRRATDETTEDDEEEQKEVAQPRQRPPSMMEEKTDSDDAAKDRPSSGAAVLGAAAVGAAAMIDRLNRRSEPDQKPDEDSPVVRRTSDLPGPAARSDELPPRQATPAFRPAAPAAAEEEPTLPPGERPARPAFAELARQRPTFGERRSVEPAAEPETEKESTPPADTEPAPSVLSPARPVGLFDPSRRPPLNPLARRPDVPSTETGESETPGVGAAAPVNLPPRRSSTLNIDETPGADTARSGGDRSPAVSETPTSPSLETPMRLPRPPLIPSLKMEDKPDDSAAKPAVSGVSASADTAPSVSTPAALRPASALRPLASTENEAKTENAPSRVPDLASRPSSSLLPRRDPVIPPVKAEDNGGDIEDENDELEDEDFEEVEEGTNGGPGVRSVLGERLSAPEVPTGRPSLVRRDATGEHAAVAPPITPPAPRPSLSPARTEALASSSGAIAPALPRRPVEPAVASASGANAPESRFTTQNRGKYEPPDFRDLLRRGEEKRINDEILLEKARTIEDTLISFGAPGKVVEVNPGPVITQFGVEPDYVLGRAGKKMRVKVGAIARLDADLALSLAAKSIRIEAPVPGKGFVGIEVPNDENSLVGLYDVMDSPEFTKIDSKLRIALGLAVDGSPVAADLTAMPHLLIAGTTGSGKSVCVNTIISCLLLQNSPQEVQFIMIDPKRVELTGYNGIPHLVAPVVVDLERIVGVLQWVQREMEERYRKFAAIAARNILDYNGKVGSEDMKMPYYVVVVDELADLMMLAPDETERLLARLAQMARATGIHLIISTQRPSVDVVTGLIKANFPARIAFAVASSVDSRVILDQPGAEKLLGRGDMLYQSPDAAAPLRMQGVYVSDDEINKITGYWKKQVLQKADASGARDALASPSRDITFPRVSPTAQPDTPPRRTATAPAPPAGQRTFWDDTDLGAGATDGESKGDDELYSEAVDLVQRLGKASISLLQRRLRIGYTRSARLIDMMEAQGLVGPAESGSKPREVLKLKAKPGDDEDNEE